MSYKKPILIEIYVGLFFEPATVSTEKTFDFVATLRENDFPLVEMPQSSITIRQGDGSQQGFPLIWRVRCWNEKKTKLVQLSTGNIYLNKVREYLGWKDFRQFFKDALALSEKAGIQILPSSLSLNTIDEFQVPSKDFTIDKYLNCTNSGVIPHWYSGTGEPSDITLGRGILQIDKHNRQIKVTVRTKGEWVTIRMECIFHNMLVNVSSDDLLEKLHTESNLTFESMITDRVRHDIMGGVN